MICKKYDVILVGAGLANGLIALRLHQQFPNLRYLMLESNARPSGNRIWSFHRNDISVEQFNWLKPLISVYWPGYQVYFPTFCRELFSGYCSITSDDFARYLFKIIGKNIITATPVIKVTPTEVTLINRILNARVVIDGRGLKINPHIRLGYQIFFGQEWYLKKPHGLSMPILMDATVEQQHGYRFVYTLPLSQNRLLIEDTYYLNKPIFIETVSRRRILSYAHYRNWQLDYFIREERGCLPIILCGNIDAIWKKNEGQAYSGLRAGLFHSTTGYSLPIAVALADYIANILSLQNIHCINKQIEEFARRHWYEQRFFRLLNRMLFFAGHPEQRWLIMQRFYQLDSNLISRFYAGKLHFIDKARILFGKPPVTISEALRALLMINP